MTQPSALPSGAPAHVAAHNTYSSLVASDDDLVGHVAYALYKRDKLKFCESMQERHARPASIQELDAFIHAAGLSTRIAAYRAEAELLLRSFSEEVLSGATEEIRRQYEAQLIADLKQAKSISRAIIENTIGNVLAIALLALLVVVLYGSRIGFLPLINDIFGQGDQDPANPQQVEAPKDQ